MFYSGGGPPHKQTITLYTFMGNKKNTNLHREKKQMWYFVKKMPDCFFRHFLLFVFTGNMTDKELFLFDGFCREVLGFLGFTDTNDRNIL